MKNFETESAHRKDFDPIEGGLDDINRKLGADAPNMDPDELRELAELKKSLAEKRRGLMYGAETEADEDADKFDAAEVSKQEGEVEMEAAMQALALAQDKIRKAMEIQARIKGEIIGNGEPEDLGARLENVFQELADIIAENKTRESTDVPEKIE
ncbi:MAG: hypothetical protein Q8L10_01790 [Candidatus Moranbacteria bacterium]|nr:hypothetical protein [Candidatus Moranbacteria bacterium]